MQLDPQAIAAGWRLIAHDSIGSTNAEALRLARIGEPGPLWITAGQQTAGRGRRGRSWHSPPGNLYASLLLIEPCPPDCAPQLSFVAALALHDAVCALAPSLASRLHFKWPNDLLFDGGKVAGILVEGETGPDRRLVVAIGIGVNCANHPTDISYPATNLRDHAVDVTVPALFAGLSRAILRRLAQWNRGDNFAAIRADWIACVAKFGEPIRLHVGAEQVDGTFEAVDPAGRLVLALPNGTLRAFSAGEVGQPAAERPYTQDIGATP